MGSVRGRRFGTDNSFVHFADQMIAEKHLKRKDIAQRAGIDQDYTYKLLRGVKKTAERDYILALGIAMEMNLEELQYALKLNEFIQLDDDRPRDKVILTGVLEGQDVMGINEVLMKKDFAPLKCSPDHSAGGQETDQM